MIRPEDATALILTGGKSTRMGRDKALIPLEGKPVIEHVIEGLSGLFPRILLSANDRETYGRFGWPVVTDIEREWGALAGVHAGLLAATTEWVFVLAVDMPLVEPDIVRAVLARADAPHAGVIPHGLGYHQPFHAAYHARRALDILKPHEGEPFHVHRFAEHPAMLHIPEEDLRAVSPDLKAFLNANTPEELEAIRRILAGRG